MKRVIVLGSTGSIGKRTLDVIRDHSEMFRVVGLSAYEKLGLLEKQIEEFSPSAFAIVKDDNRLKVERIAEEHNVRAYTGLEGLEKMLEELGGGSDRSDGSSADQKMRELFLTPEEETDKGEGESETKTDSTEEPPPLEKAMGKKVEPNFETITKQHLSASARDQAVDGLMGELNAEMKSPDPDWDKIQRIMGDLLGLKQTGELLDRLRAETNTPGVKWESIREIMAQLWSIKKEIIIDLLPTLLKS